MARIRLRWGAVLIALWAGLAQAQHETIYMAVLSSFRRSASPDGNPAFGLFISSDRGLNWHHRGWREYIRTFYSEEASDGTIWSACGNGVLRSTDAGKSWRVTTGWEVTEVLKVKAAEQNPKLVFAATAYGIFRSTDRGETWEKKAQGMRRTLTGDVCIDRRNPMRVLAASEEGVYLSEDGGEHWDERGLSGRGVRVVMQDPIDQDHFWLGTEEDGVFRSSDGGKNWDNRYGGLKGSAVYTIAFHPSRRGCLYAGTYGGGVYRTADSGEHWESRSRGLGNKNVHALVVLPSDPTVILAGTLGGGLFRTSDGGDTWKYVSGDSSQVWGLSLRSSIR